MSSRKNIDAQEAQRLMLNQVRHRILQYIHRRGSVTVKEIGEELIDIPQATMYRQVKLLSDSGLICICGQRRIRGTLEYTYRLSMELVGDDGKALGDMSTQFALLSIAQDFSDYYHTTDADPDRDMMSVESRPMLLSDDEFKEYLKGIKELTDRYLHNEPDADRRVRKVTFISSPA
ncbi:MAG: helix-turn-helix domain-containing protein [Lachnospiraceae bacterium]|nr:helix-turn-helix domain-containing protein [Lachnospiraceae bacterium]